MIKVKLQTIYHVLLAAMIVLLSGCDSKEVLSSSDNSIPGPVYSILESKCMSCHSATTAQGGFGYVTNPAQMISAGLIEPGNTEDSVLYQKLTTNPPYGARMPRDGNYLSESEMATMADWINNSVGVTPSLTISNPANSSYIDTSNNSATFAVTGLCNVNTAAITIDVNGTALTGSSTTCNGTSFSTTIDTTAAPFITGANTLTLTMTKASLGISLTSSVTVTKDLTALSIALLSVSNSSVADRNAASSDNSLVTTASVTYPVSGTCSSAGRTVTVKFNTTDMATATCDGTNFNTTVNTIGLADGTYRITASMTDASNATVSASASIYYYTAAPTVSWATDIMPLFTVPRAGNQRACIDCHYVRLSGNPSANFSLGYWNSCVSGGKPVGAAGACADTSATSAYTTSPDNTERQAFNFKIGYYKYTSTTPTSNEGNYANRALSIVNDNPTGPNLVANRIVRGVPSQSFIYRKLLAANELCHNSLTNPTAQDVGCRTSQSTTSGQMPPYNATYVPNFFNSTEYGKIQTWIMEGARTDN